MQTPTHLTDRELWSTATSQSRQRRIESAREEARELFNRTRHINDKDLELIFPGISNSRGVVQAAVPAENGAGNVQPHELIIISTICSYLKPDLVFEFGTFNGMTTLHFAMNSPESAKIVTIDLDPDDPRRGLVNDDTYYISDSRVGLMFQGVPEREKIIQVFGDTQSFNHEAYRGKADLIFIDAGHEYDLVRSDTEKALEMLAPNGLILWHDYVFSHYGVHTWLNEISQVLPLHSIPNSTIVCYKSPSTPLSLESVIQDLRALPDLPSARATSAKESTTLLNRIAMRMPRLRQTVTPIGSRRERLVRQLLS